jgi:transcriptional regulator with XRE-family HTH domain
MGIAHLTGSRLRERRLAVGMRQVELARAAGISASYLNLIEANRRRIGAEVLERLAAALGIAPAALTEETGAILAADLRDAAAGAAGIPPELDRIEDFAARFPGWAGLVAAQHRRQGALERAIEALSDRMAHDPHLSAALHEVLSTASSVRATASILAGTGDLPPQWRDRFLANLDADSARLAAGTEGLVAYLDASGADADKGIAAPQEELEAWLEASGWHLPGLEPGAPPQARAAVRDTARGLASAAARALAQGWIARAEAEAAALPEPAFTAALEGLGPDPIRLAARFGADVVAVFRRMALRPGAVQGLVICDGSGTLVLRKPPAGFGFPRFGAACPLWPLYAALGRPGVPVSALVEMPGRIPRRFRVLAYCSQRYPEGFAGPPVAEAAMLIAPAEAGAAGAAVPVGVTCRICPRAGCPARREPSILAEAGPDSAVLTAAPFAPIVGANGER